MKIKHLLFVILAAGLFFTCDKTSENLEVITYPETGKYGINILADGVAMVNQTGSLGRFEYSVRAELPTGNSSLKIVIRNAKTGYEYAWGEIVQGYEENCVFSSWDKNLEGNILTVFESGKPADARVFFSNDCIIEYYENGATEPTKVKEIKVIL